MDRQAERDIRRKLKVVCLGLVGHLRCGSLLAVEFYHVGA